MKFFAILFTFLSGWPTWALPTTISGRTVQDTTPIDVEIGDKKALVAVFLSVKCPCSNSHVEELRSLSREYPDFKFVAIHSIKNESEPITKSYFEHLGLPFPVIRDSDLKIAEEFKASKTPHAFVVLNNGSLAYHGGVSDSRDFGSSKIKFLREAIDQVHKGEKVKRPYERTLGCAIPRGGKSDW